MNAIFYRAIEAFNIFFETVGKLNNRPIFKAIILVAGLTLEPFECVSLSRHRDRFTRCAPVESTLTALMVPRDKLGVNLGSPRAEE
jgi:hypothetical protein